MLLLAVPAHAQPRLPALGDSASEELSPVAERRLGEGIMADAWRQRAIFDDAELTEYVTYLAATSARLALAAPCCVLPAFAWTTTYWSMPVLGRSICRSKTWSKLIMSC